MKKIYILDNDNEYNDHEIVFAEVDAKEWPNFEQLATIYGWIILGTANHVDWALENQPCAFHPKLPITDIAGLFTAYSPWPGKDSAFSSDLLANLADAASPSEARILHERWSAIYDQWRKYGDDSNLPRGISKLRQVFTREES